MARPRIGKSGGVKIAAILDDPDRDLTKAMATVGKSFFSTDSNRAATPRKSTYTAIATVRSHYKGMSRRIDKIPTGRKDAKKDVLDALKRFDSSLASFADALPDERTPEGVAKLRSAARKAARASSDLEKARSRLT